MKNIYGDMQLIPKVILEKVLWANMKSKVAVSFTLRAIFVNPEDALGHLWLPGESFLIGSQWGSILFNQHLREKIICINLWPIFAVCFDHHKPFTIENVSLIDVEHS